MASGKQKQTNDPAAFPQHLLNLSILQLMTRSAPFTHTKTVPLHVFSHIVAEYIYILGASAKANADLSGRSSCSVWDVGRALGEFGLASNADLFDEISKKDGATEEAKRVRSLATSLKDPDAGPEHTPFMRLVFEELGQREIEGLAELERKIKEEPEVNERAESNADSDIDDATPPSSSSKIYSEPPIPANCLWRDVSEIPSFVNPFLPPFPGMEKDSLAAADNVKKKKEREKEKEREEAAEAWMDSHGLHEGNLWVSAVPYNNSMMAELNSLPPTPPSPAPVADEAGPSKRKRRKSLEMVPKTYTSLDAFNSCIAELNKENKWMKLNNSRRAAATAISLSSDMSLANDSLFGTIPVPLVRSAGLGAGFVPEDRELKINGLNSNLPHTIATPVPAKPTPYARLMASVPNPRIPTLLESMAYSLSQPTSKHLELFSRTTRIGPPGPLGVKGETLDYEYVADSSVVRLNVEWPEKRYEQRIQKLEIDEKPVIRLSSKEPSTLPEPIPSSNPVDTIVLTAPSAPDEPQRRNGTSLWPETTNGHGNHPIVAETPVVDNHPRDELEPSSSLHLNLLPMDPDSLLLGENDLGFDSLEPFHPNLEANFLQPDVGDTSMFEFNGTHDHFNNLSNGLDTHIKTEPDESFGFDTKSFDRSHPLSMTSGL